MESESLTHNCLFVPTISGKVIRIRNPFILSLLVVCKMFIFRIDAVISSPLTADNCPGLAGRPKLIFVQACQGKVTLLLLFFLGGGDTYRIVLVIQLQSRAFIVDSGSGILKSLRLRPSALAVKVLLKSTLGKVRLQLQPEWPGTR